MQIFKIWRKSRKLRRDRACLCSNPYEDSHPANGSKTSPPNPPLHGMERGNKGGEVKNGFAFFQQPFERRHLEVSEKTARREEFGVFTFR